MEYITGDEEVEYLSRENEIIIRKAEPKKCKFEVEEICIYQNPENGHQYRSI